MRKKLEYIIFALVLSIFCVNVRAAELAKCSYNYEIKGTNLTFPLNFTLSSDKKVTMTKEYTTSNDRTWTISYKNKFETNFVDVLYSNGKLNSKCPEINICYYLDQQQLFVYPSNDGGITCPDGDSPTLESGNLTILSPNIEQNPNNDQVYCGGDRLSDKIVRPVKGMHYVELKFFTENGEKYFSVKNVETEKTAKGKYNQAVSLTVGDRGYTFRINPNLVSKYFSSECASTPKYFDLNDTSSSITITNVKPSDANNGSYAVGEEWQDDGQSIGTKPPSGDKKDDFTTNPKKCTSCGNGALTDIPVQLPTFTRNLIKLLQVVIPLILIALGIYDFIRAIIASEEKLMQESQKRFIRRIVASVLIFFVIAIVKLIFGLIPENVNTLGCVPCFTSDASSCGETYTCNY